ncbi:MAG: tripartite tricarboxylate transporter permease [Nanoarchaeota archaeon]
MLQEIISLIIGCTLGIITGLIPGLHINLIASLILAFSNFLLKYTSDLNLIIIIISMSITHLFLDILPSIFLGIPNQDTAVTILPAHKLLLEGKAQEAVFLTLLGTIFSIILICFLLPFLILILSNLNLFLKNHIHIILILLSIILILREKQRFLTLTIFLLAGTLGFITLNLPNTKEPLLPLLSGLFGLSSLILSIKNNSKIPEQIEQNLKIEFKKFKFVFLGSIAGIFSAFLPGLGSSQTSVLVSSLIRKIESKDFLILNSSINSVNLIGSFITLFAINKARSGIAVAISELTNLTLNKLIFIISIILITVFIATVLTIFFSKIFSKLISKINYKKLCLVIIIFITLLVLLISKPIGLLILVTSTSLGIFTQLKQVNKNHLMGCLLLPVILYFLN